MRLKICERYIMRYKMRKRFQMRMLYTMHKRYKLRKRLNCGGFIKCVPVI